MAMASGRTLNLGRRVGCIEFRDWGFAVFCRGSVWSIEPMLGSQV